MVTVLPQKTGIGSQIGQSLGMGLGQGFQGGLSQAMQQHFDQRQASQQAEQKDKTLRDFLESEEGSKLSPLQKTALSAHSKGLIPEGSLKSIFEPTDYLADEKSYDTIKGAFGEQFADIWKASPQGARTELTKVALDAQLRGQKIEDLLSGRAQKGKEEGLQKPESEFPEYDLKTDGMKPSELPSYQKELRKENVPRLQEAITKERSLKKDLDSIHILESINQSGKLPSGFGSLLGSLVNPKTGNLIIPSKASPSVQRFVKTVNDFTTRAKDSYGGRVTNFELDRFMQRLPTLANSEEGRTAILKQMQITNEIDRLHEDAVRKVYQHYGAGKITFEDADSIASSLVRDQEEKLRSEYDLIDSAIEHHEASQEMKSQEGNVPQGFVLMYDPQGNELHVPQDQVQKYKSLGAIQK